ncbi:FHA domain-containing protein [Trichothermofontia sichuanensis B231]|uniref:adenylate/guanylate cyclase domain-containing protein n=1 Tax=Trichothermofontia sichuanensis TaxID=3045816 RepID=UPI0022469C89|nr:adenylate/guanylate cyclase domain-containing protein [Trichothermofontia sichuanensis]UZQ55174.1 FHA domain-containing protein [Trichothermofontia sichuanensis B231]
MPYLLIHNPGTPQEKTYVLRFGFNTIGREQDNSIVLPNDARGMSRHHAGIIINDERVVITDRHSSNGTYVNDLKITQTELKSGDIIHCGSEVFRFEHRPDVSILHQVSPDETRFTMRDLVHSGIFDYQGSILRLRQQDQSQQAVDKLKILLEVSKQLSNPEAFEHLPEKILELLFQIMDIDRAVLLLVNPETGVLEEKAVKMRPNVPTENQFYSRQIVEMVCEKGDAILTSDAKTDERFLDSFSIMNQSIHASMCTPLKPRDRVLGVLYVDNLSIADVYSGDDLEFLTALANQAAIAIDNATLYQTMQAEAVKRAKLERFFPQAVSKRIIEENGDLPIIETEVTALFSDISGYTELSSTMEPYQVLEMLNEYFKVMVEDIVFRYEGTLEKYIADALLAVWGSPYPHEDDVQRAVWAAIEMQWAMTRLNQQWLQKRNLQMHIHIGLNTGPVAAGNIGSPQLIQYAHIGDTMNVTSRICNAAKAGEILISQSTYDRLMMSGMKLAIEKIPAIFVKGKTLPLQLYRLPWQQIKIPR